MGPGGQGQRGTPGKVRRGGAVGRTHRYVSLEPPDIRAAAASDPRGFLDAHVPPVILDEVHCAPDLLPFIKERVDARRAATGQYLLTGSQNLLLLERVTESLAGRAAILRLLPLSQRETTGRAAGPLPWEAAAGHPRSLRPSPQNVWPTLLSGGYPEIVAHPGRDLYLWQTSYVQTYLERDVRALRQVGDLTQFQSFLRALAVRSAQLLNMAGLARDLGLALNTVKSWISILETTHQIVLLRPYFANLTKRLVKTPKVYFTDTGLLGHLVGLRDPVHAAQGPMGGAILETAVFLEILKTMVHRGEEPRIYFWRTATGTEVDFLVEHEGRLVPVEVKLSATPMPGMADGIRAFQRDLGRRAGPGYVIHPGTVRGPLAPAVQSLPFAEL